MEQPPDSLHRRTPISLRSDESEPGGAVSPPEAADGGDLKEDAPVEGAPVSPPVGPAFTPPMAPPGAEGTGPAQSAPAYSSPASVPVAEAGAIPGRTRRPLPTYRTLLITVGIPGGFALLGVFSIMLWLSAPPPIQDDQLRAPVTGEQPGFAQPGPSGWTTGPSGIPGAPGPGLSPNGTGPAGPNGGGETGLERPTNEPPELGNEVPGPGEPGADPPVGIDIMGGDADPAEAMPGPPSGGGMPPFGGPGMRPGPSGGPMGGRSPTAPEPAGDGDDAIPPLSRNRAGPDAGSGGALAIGSWSGFRGPNLDNISKETVPLARSWGAGGPPRLWQVPLGEGHAGPAVHKGRVYVLDYDQKARADVLRCLSLANGKQIWSSAYPVEVKRNHGMSRTVPAVTDKHVVTLGPKCHVMCCDANTGKVLWRKDLVKEYGTKVPTWYAGQCPLIDGSRVILAPAGSALMIAVDLASGKVLWQAPNPRKWSMTHSSIAPMSLGGKRMYVYCGSGGVAGVSSDGKLLWDTTEWKVSTATVPTPVPIGDGRIFLCGGYNSGAMMLRLKQSGSRITPEVAFRLKVDVFGSDQQTPILYNGHLYGVVPNPAGQLACLDLSGRRLWTSGRTKTFGLGPYVMAGGLLYVLGDKGDLALVEPNPAGYKELARAKVLQGHDAWGPMAIVGGRLLARDLTTMVCLDVKQH